MCGIIASRGCDAGRITLQSLRQLEYRGYDSAGVGVVTNAGGIRIERAIGKLECLLDRVGGDDTILAATTAIGHTRWATHGSVSLPNAHPVSDCKGRVAVVHNGVIENAAALRSELELRGHHFGGDVDSELIAHLLEDAIAGGLAPLDAMRKTVAQLEGAWAIAAIVTGHDGLVLARQGSPLLVRGDEHAVVVASDAPATASVAGPLRALGDGDVVELGSCWRWVGSTGEHSLPPALDDTTTTTAASVVPRYTTATASPSGGAGNVMAAEIAEQAEIAEKLVAEVIRDRGRGSGWYDLDLPMPRRIQLVACGSSYYAGLVIARTLRTVARIPTEVTIASEYELPGTLDATEGDQTEPADLTIAISQSGETADVLTALSGNEGPLIAITNSIWSSLAQRADAVLDCCAGVERGVAATKSFTAQVIVGIGLAIALAQVNGRAEAAERARVMLGLVPGRLARADAHATGCIRQLVTELADRPGWLFLGAGSGLPYAAEGALKLKEVTYRWAQSYPASELKHGPLALVEQGTPVVVVDNGLRRLELSIAEVTSRGGRVIRIGGRHSDVGPVLSSEDPPWGPLASVVPMQHLARELGVALGRDVDRPRNLAKSVTVR